MHGALLSNWPARTIASDVRAYAPGVALWSDGADKSRYVWLPPHTVIDTSRMDEWTFPIGTKFWKEFRVNGRLVETRFLWKLSGSAWLRTTYAWTADESEVRLRELTAGEQSVNGTSYEIPSQAMCTTCHQGRIDGILGFEAVGLAAPGASGLTLSELVSEGLLTQPPTSPIVIPGDANASGALGWLHANCGNACHNPSPHALAGATGLFMRLEVESMAAVEDTATWNTAVNDSSNFQPTATSDMLLIDPGNPGNSSIVFRDSTRDDAGQGFQMPPIDTHVVPDAGVAVVSAWISEIPPQPVSQAREHRRPR